MNEAVAPAALCMPPPEVEAPHEFPVTMLLVIVAILATTWSLVAEKRIAIDFARKELAGNRYLAAVRDIYGGILTGSVPQTTSPDEILKMLAAAQTADAPEQMQTMEFEQELGGALRLLQWSQTEDAKVDFLVLDALTKARRLVLRVGEESKLILDPELDSYYLQDVIVTKLPVVLGFLVITSESRHPAPPTPAAEPEKAQVESPEDNELSPVEAE